MKRDELIDLAQKIKNIQQGIEKYKQRESHLEKSRILKLIDAELMDALKNLEYLIRIVDK